MRRIGKVREGNRRIADKPSLQRVQPRHVVTYDYVLPVQ